MGKPLEGLSAETSSPILKISPAIRPMSIKIKDLKFTLVAAIGP